MSLVGLEFHVMIRKGVCYNCRLSLNKGDKSIIVGSFSNKYRYCASCFIKTIESEFDVEILDFIGD